MHYTLTSVYLYPFSVRLQLDTTKETTEILRCKLMITSHSPFLALQLLEATKETTDMMCAISIYGAQQGFSEQARGILMETLQDPWIKEEVMSMATKVCIEVY